MKIILALAAIAAATVVVPGTASAQDVRVRIGNDRGYHQDYRGPRAEYRGYHDRGLHRGWRNRDRVVVIKERRRHWDD
jgi:hypothetical protein